MKTHTHRTCRSCGGSLIALRTVASTPLEDKYTQKPNRLPKYPLDLSLCRECGLVQLATLISAKTSYQNYLYQSKTTSGLLQHYEDYAKWLIKKLRLKKSDLIVDLGSNDGSFLSCFRDRGLRVLGVEPAVGPARAANRSGIPTKISFFDESLARRIRNDYGQPKVITANYMFANLENLNSFLGAVVNLAGPQTTFALQTGYHPDQWRKMMFDYIYHEHFYYFTLSSLQNLLSRNSLQILHAERVSPKGGSLRVLACLSGAQSPSQSADKIFRREKQQKVHHKDYYHRFFSRLKKQKKTLLKKINRNKSKGIRMVGFGASHSTTTLLHCFGLARFLDYIVDDNPLKHFRFSPGTNLRVLPSQHLYRDKPDLAVILGWQHAEGIIKRHSKFLKQGGKFLVPLPYPKDYPADD